jgi:hypothetical protein
MLATPPVRWTSSVFSLLLSPPRSVPWGDTGWITSLNQIRSAVIEHFSNCCSADHGRIGTQEQLTPNLTSKSINRLLPRLKRYIVKQLTFIRIVQD